MRVQGDPGFTRINLHSKSEKENKPRMVVRDSSKSIRYDTVELNSVAAKQLPVGVIEQKAPKFFFNTEINSSLDKVLSGKDPEVSKAVYLMIESNLFANNAELNDEERASMLELGVSQAEFLADNYMMADESTEFLDTIYMLAAVSKTRRIDPTTGNVTYADLPQKPSGAPDDYINTTQLMKRFDPAAYTKLQNAHINGSPGGSLLIEFTHKLRQHPDWLIEYRKEQDSIIRDLKNSKIENRFKGSNMMNINKFAKEIEEQIDQMSLTNKDLLKQNLASFALLLSSRK